MTPEQITARAARNIRREMKSRNWNQGDLVERADMTQPDVSRLLNSEKSGRAASLPTLIRVADAFGIDIADLLADRPDPPKPAPKPRKGKEKS